MADNDDLVSRSMDRFRNNSLGELVEPRLECGSSSIDIIKRQNPIVEGLIDSPTPAGPFEQENEQDKTCNRTQRIINERSSRSDHAMKYSAADHAKIPRRIASTNGTMVKRKYLWFAIA